MSLHPKKSSPLKGLFRVLIGLIGLSIAVAIILPIAAFIFFDPNDYKEQIGTFITENSGLPLEIHGKIEMKYFPWLGLNVQDIRLAQAPSFGDGQFINVEAIDFKMPVRELLRRHLIIESLNVKGLEVHLVKQANGSTNWDYFSKQIKEKKATADKPKTQATDDNKPKKKKLTFALNNVDATDAAIFLEDKQQQETIALKNLQLKGHAGQQPNVFPISGQFNLSQQNNKTKQILSGHNEFKGQLSFAKGFSANLDTSMSLTLPQSLPWQEADVNMHIDIDPTKAITLSDIRFHAGDTNATGSCTIAMNKNVPISFKLAIDQLNLDKLQKKANNNTANAASGNAKTTQTNVSSQVSKPITMPALNGEITIKQLIAKDLTLDNVKATIKTENNVLKANPLTADFYQGRLSLSATKDLAKASAPVLLQGSLNNIEMQNLLAALKQEQYISGRASIDFNLAQSEQMPNGIVKMHLKNGTLNGIDVKYYLNLAQSLFNKEKAPGQDTKSTPFGDLTATLALHDNMIDNNDLLITSPDFKANGDGSINLNNKTIEYKLKAFRQYSDNREHTNYPLAIRIKGTLQHPKVEPDMDLYMKASLEKEMKKQVEKNLNKFLGVKPSNNNDASQNNSQNTEKSPEDVLKEKLEKKINKGLKKLFKEQ
ncbi:MAG: hypothetical protein BGO43_06670 [Gammaproteobacteria bacterium 39-13]|nr:AsmA family protein [Gammaproteobacteria bacterium]OJV90523.1 MAG: hypothetical protein BGO43_06670 [Gammaproteobacteria bacterium 39-13]